MNSHINGDFFSLMSQIKHITIQKHWQMHINEEKKVENNRVYCLYQLNTLLTKLFADSISGEKLGVFFCKNYVVCDE